jgi:hypothetical protein
MNESVTSLGEVQLTPHVWLVPSDGSILWNWAPPGATKLKNVLFDVMHWQNKRQLSHGLVPDGLIGPATWQLRDGRLRRLARRCLREMERAGLSRLHTYRTITWLVESEVR